MKKLMIAAAIVCAAAMSQAATANWSTPMTTYAGQLDTDEGSYDVKWAIIEGATADLAKGVSFANGSLVGATAFDSGTSIGVELGGAQDGTLTGATAGKYYALLISYDDKELWGVSDAWLAATDTTDDSGNTLKAFTFQNGVAFDMEAMVANQAVPEPTSGLLLLLGVAGLALRRRRA